VNQKTISRRSFPQVVHSRSEHKFFDFIIASESGRSAGKLAGWHRNFSDGTHRVKWLLKPSGGGVNRLDTRAGAVGF
jgi:hypothetical protein